MLRRLGLTGKEFLALVLLLANFWLLYTGHSQIAREVANVSAQAQACELSAAR